MTTKSEFVDVLKSLDKIRFGSDSIKIDDKSHRYVAKIFYNNVDAVARCYKENSLLNRVVFQNETRVLEFFGVTDLLLPKVLYKDQKKLLIVESFLKGQSGGDSLSFDADFIKNIIPESVARFLKTVEKYHPDIINLPEGFQKRYLENVEFIKKNYPSNSSEEVRTIDNFIRNADYSKKNLCLSHGDANPGNFIFEKNNFGMIDWETVEYTFFWNDLANVYIASYDWPFWQKSFLDSFGMKKAELNNFKLGVIFKLANIIAKLNIIKHEGKSEFFRSKKMSEKELGERMKFYQEKIKDLII